ncbi:thioesterase family protein [Streptomyces sp. CFMR 7]|uniref:acyl-CoA thioesterase n=1 Tax=Streptomyces sp. CFMR 7 TaxID=1649184 RepID=UPI0011A26CFD|nr:thioesterase family protein [Streptomyces sp. CFMR 7]
MTYTYPLPLRWADQDSYGHINNSSFLTYFEEARTRMVAAMLPPDEAERGRNAFVVQQALIDYKAPLDYRNDPVSVDVWVTRCRGARLELGCAIRDIEKTYAEATIKMAAYDLETGAPRRMTEQELAYLSRYSDS